MQKMQGYVLCIYSALYSLTLKTNYEGWFPFSIIILNVVGNSAAAFVLPIAAR